MLGKEWQCSIYTALLNFKMYKLRIEYKGSILFDYNNGQYYYLDKYTTDLLLEIVRAGKSFDGEVPRQFMN